MDNISDHKRYYQLLEADESSERRKLQRKRTLLRGKVRKRRGLERFVDFLIYGGTFLIIGVGTGIYLIIYILPNG